MREPTTQKLMGVLIVAAGAVLVWFFFGGNAEQRFVRPGERSNQVARAYQSPMPNYQPNPMAPRQAYSEANYRSHAEREFERRTAGQRPNQVARAYQAPMPSYQPNPMAPRQAYSEANYRSRAEREFERRTAGQRPNQVARAYQSPMPNYQPNPMTDRRSFPDTHRIAQHQQPYPTTRQADYLANAVAPRRVRNTYVDEKNREDSFRMELSEANPRSDSFVQWPELPSVESNQISNVQSTNYESKIPDSDSILDFAPPLRSEPTPEFAPILESDLTPSSIPNQVQVDKRVRKANWAEIEMAPPVDSMRTHRPLQRVVLPRRRANPQVEARAREHITYGESLTRRRAFFAAREEFIRALLLISSSYNAESNSTVYPERFAQALTAMDEASDFVFSGQDAGGMHIQQKVRSHKSRLLAPQDIATTSPTAAIGLYSSFAQSQIEQAIGYSVVGSEALHALGKLESIVPETNGQQARTSQAKALVFFRAAININPANAVCANDLGVLLFNMGRLQEAENALKASLGSSQSQLVWNNLALVHRQRAATAISAEQRNQQLWLADVATKEAQEYVIDPQNNRIADSQWATASEFQNNAAFPDTVVQHASDPLSENAPSQGTNKPASIMQKVKGWF